MNNKSPCLDCEYRHPHCHSKCQPYIDFAEERKALHAARVKWRRDTDELFLVKKGAGSRGRRT